MDRNFVFFFLVLQLLLSCKQRPAKDKSIEFTQSLEADKSRMQQDIQKIRNVLYVFPTPVELANSIRHSSVEYREDVMNPLENFLGYTTSHSKALNLGVYCADLSYASMFDQPQTAMMYVDASRKLAESMGIVRLIDKEKLDLLEANVNNKSLILDLVSEIYMESRQQLKEQDRYSLAVLILVGGWVESMYIATQLTDRRLDTHLPLVERIVDQKYSLGKVIEVLKENGNDVQVQSILSQFLNLQTIYDRILVEEGDFVIETDSIRHLSIVKAETLYRVDPDVYNLLCEKIESIRDQFINCSI